MSDNIDTEGKKN